MTYCCKYETLNKVSAIFKLSQEKRLKKTAKRYCYFFFSQSLPKSNVVILAYFSFVYFVKSFIFCLLEIPWIATTTQGDADQVLWKEININKLRISAACLWRQTGQPMAAIPFHFAYKHISDFNACAHKDGNLNINSQTYSPNLVWLEANFT